MITKQTLKLWETLGKTIKRIEKHNAHQIDVDTAQQICRELYAELLSLEKVEKVEKTIDTEEKETKISANTNQHIKQQAEETPAEIDVESKKDLPKAEEKSNDSNETILSKIEALEETVETKTEESIKEEVIPETTQTNTEQPKHKPQTSLFETNEKSVESLGESLGKNIVRKHESISTNTGNDIVGKFQNKPINDIKAAISLGDRFLFIKELFNGNADDFNQTIQQLNNQSDFDTAKALLNHRNWDNENETVKFFYSIVQRKYLKI